VNLNYQNAWGFSEGLGLVQLNGEWGYINKQGVMMIALQFEEAEGFSEGLAAVKIKGKWGYIDRTGMTVIPAQFDSAWYFDGGIAEISLDDAKGLSRFTYIGTKGKLLIEPWPSQGRSEN